MGLRCSELSHLVNTLSPPVLHGLPHPLPLTLRLVLTLQPPLLQHALEGSETEGADPQVAIVSHMLARDIA
jgi:hypothetical protein